MAHVVRDRQPHALRSGEVSEKAIATLFLWIEMALQIDRQPLAEEALKTSEGRARALRIAPCRRSRERARRAAGEAKQAFDVRHEIVERHSRRPLAAPSAGAWLLAGLVLPNFRSGEQPAKVLVAHAVLHQQQESPAGFEHDLGADERADACVLRRAKEARRSVHPVTVAEPERRIAEARRYLDEILR